MTSHANCPHPATKAARSACRKANGHIPTSRGTSSTPSAPRKVEGGPRSIAEACEVGNIDHDTLDDRIRAARRRPAASAVKVSKVEGR